MACLNAADRNLPESREAQPAADPKYRVPGNVWQRLRHATHRDQHAYLLPVAIPLLRSFPGRLHEPRAENIM